MSGPCVEQLKNLGQTFKILRATPVSPEKIWVAAAANKPYVKNTTCGGIVGTRRPTASGITWSGGLTTALADSTVLVIYDAVTGKLNYGLTQSDAEAFFASSDATESVSATCLYDICSGDRPNPLLCADLPEADGVLQFIAQLCASPAISYFGEGLSLTIAKPSFYDPTNPLNPGCQTASSNSFIGCGNWTNFTFNIGACGSCTADVDLIYIGSVVDSSSEECDTTICYDKEWTQGNTFIYAPVKFTLTNRDGQKQSFKRACYIKIEPLNTCFNVFFAQTRNCDSTINILIISCLVDLSCLYWGGSVYIITSPRARYTIPPL